MSLWTPEGHQYVDGDEVSSTVYGTTDGIKSPYILVQSRRLRQSFLFVLLAKGPFFLSYSSSFSKRLPRQRPCRLALGRRPMCDSMNSAGRVVISGRHL